MKCLLCLCLCCGLALGQSDEQRKLQEAVAEAGNSPVEMVRALERHLAAYPQSTQRAELERALVKLAIEQKDNRRLLLYGEQVLARDTSDLQILDRVSRLLLNSDDRESATKALKYSEAYVAGLRGLDKNKLPREDLERAISRGLLFQSRAKGNLGQLEEALKLAQQGYDLSPSAEAARELARWLGRAGRDPEAIDRLAEAFIMPDPRVTEADRARDRVKLGELYQKAKGTQTGLGDVILRAYDRSAATLSEQQKKLQATDPNGTATTPFGITLSGVKGDPLALQSLKGKVVVMDFWATWCGPCRVQHPLYEEVKKKFANRPEVVFLAVNSDEDRTTVAPFLLAQKWNHAVYFDDGLGQLLKVSSLPTTIVLNRSGEITSRMNGFVPERFVAMLTDRIEEALR